MNKTRLFLVALFIYVPSAHAMFLLENQLTDDPPMEVDLLGDGTRQEFSVPSHTSISLTNHGIKKLRLRNPNPALILFFAIEKADGSRKLIHVGTKKHQEIAFAGVAKVILTSTLEALQFPQEEGVLRRLGSLGGAGAALPMETPLLPKTPQRRGK